MPAIRFDGVGDGITLSPGTCTHAGAHTLIVVARKNTWSVWSGLIDGEGASSSQVTTALELDNGAGPANLNYSTQATAASPTTPANAQVASLTAWYGLAAGRAAGTTTPTFGKRDLTANTTFTSSGGSSTIPQSATTLSRIIFGLWNGTDDFNGWIACAAWFNGALSTSQIAECFANRRTSDIWNNSFGRPAGLWEFNVAPGSVADLTGNGANWSTTQGNPALDNSVTPDWTFDGLGPSTRKFNGTSDSITVGPGSLTTELNSAHTIVSLVKPSTIVPQQAITFAKNGLAFAVGMYLSGSGLTYGGDFVNTGDPQANVGVTANQWQILAVSRPGGASQTVRMHRSELGTGVWTHANGGNSASNPTGNLTNVYHGQLGDGASLFWNGDIGWVAYFNRNLSDIELEAFADQTSDVQSASGGPPLAIWEFNQSAVTTSLSDLGTHGLNQTARSGTTVVNEGPFAGAWLFDGSSAPSPATAPGQYGWGTYGVGNYGPNFGGISATPIVGSDSINFTEQASVIVVTASVNDALSQAESVSAIAADLQRGDGLSFAEATAIAATLATLDSSAHSESPAVVTFQQLLAAADAWGLSEASLVDVALARSDSGLLAELSAVAATLATADAWALTESPVSIQSVNLINATDSWTVAEAVASLTSTDAKSASDSALTTDTVQGINATVTASDLIGLLEASAVNATLLTGEAFSMTEVSLAQAVQLLTASDALTQIEKTSGGSSISTTTLGLSPTGYWIGGTFTPGQVASNVLPDQSGHGYSMDSWHNMTPTGYPAVGTSIIPSMSSQTSMDLLPDSNFWKNQGFLWDFVTANRLSLSFWAKPRSGSFDTTWHDAVRRGAQFGITTDYNGSQNVWRAHLGRASASTLVLDYPATVNQLVHLALTWDGTDFRFYVNGSQYASSLGAGGTILTSSENFVFGQYASGANGYDGLLDEVAVFNYALSASDVQSIYNAGLGVGGFAGSITANTAASELASLLENSLVAGTVFFSANDSISASEQAAILANLSRADTFTAADLSSLATILDVVANDSATQSEQPSALSATVGASDAASVTDTVLGIAQTLQKAASDSFAFNESSTLAQIVAITRTDTFTLNVEAAGIVELVTAPYIHHKVPLDGIVQELTTGGTVLAMVADGVVISATTAGAVTDAAASGIAPTYTASGTVLDVSDDGTAPVYAADGAID